MRRIAPALFACAAALPVWAQTADMLESDSSGAASGGSPGNTPLPAAVGNAPVPDGRFGGGAMGGLLLAGLLLAGQARRPRG